MKKYLFTLMAAFALWGYAGASLPTSYAQDVSTPSPEGTPVVIAPPAPTVEKTAESTAQPTEPAPAPLFNPATAGELLLFLGLSALAGGGIVAIVLSFLGKKEVRDRVEDARNSWSPEQQAMLANFTNGFERVTSGVLDFLKSVQDGQPNVDVVAQVTSEVAKQLPAAVSSAVSDAKSVG